MVGFPATIVLLTYNQQDLVADAVRSMLEQDCEPIEILISDDCSTDGTWGVIQGCVAGYAGPHRVRLNRNAHNIGLIPHYNRCFEMAGADIVLVAAGDDISYPDRVSRTLAAFRSDDRPLLVFSRVELDRLNTPDCAAHFPRDMTFYDGIYPEAACVSSALYVGATAAYHKELWRKYGPLPEEPCYEDMILGFRAALERRAVMTAEPLVHYRLGGISTEHLVSECDTTWKREHRLREMRKYECVARQRLKDCRTFGLAPRDLIVRKLEKWHLHLKMRISAAGGVDAAFMLKNVSHPLELLGALNDRRKMLRKKA